MAFVKVCVLLRAFIIILLLFSSMLVYSQRYRNESPLYAYSPVLIELGGGTGGMNCLTDLGGNKGIGRKFLKDINWKNTQRCSNVFIGAIINDAFSLHLQGTFGTVQAYDSILSKYKNDDATKGRYFRNLSFKSNITEIALTGEIHPLLLKDYYDNVFPHLSPYLLAGIATFSFNPQAYVGGQWVDLQPLRTEGQGFREYRDRSLYRLRSISFPVGLGLRYEISSLFFARVEVVHRFTSTDYLDDVSQGTYIDPSLFPAYLSPANAAMATRLYDRHYELNPAYQPVAGDIRGDSKDNDSYFTFNLKLSFVFRKRN
jgi:hypothetical protein